MAFSSPVVISGDTSALSITSHNESVASAGGWTLLSGSFVGSPDERRVAVLFLPGDPTVADVHVLVRCEFFNPRFAERTITGERHVAAV